MTSISTFRTRQRSTAVALPIAIVIAAVAGILLDLVIAAIAHGAGASTSFMPLKVGSFAALTILGLVLAGVAWVVIRSRAARPTAVLSFLVPIVVLLSFVPDLLVGFSKSQAGTSWGAVIALMAMHLAVAACGIFSFRTLLPLTDRDDAKGPSGARQVLANLVRAPGSAA